MLGSVLRPLSAYPSPLPSEPQAEGRGEVRLLQAQESLSVLRSG